MYLYYWSDACPIIGSGLFDYYRRPYRAYESMKAVYTPVLVSLEWNKDPYIIGWEKIWVAERHVCWQVLDHQRTWTIRSSAPRWHGSWSTRPAAPSSARAKRL